MLDDLGLLAAMEWQSNEFEKRSNNKVTDDKTTSDIESENETEFACQYCKKTFSHYQSKWKHEKDSCKKKNNKNNKYEDKIIDLEKQLKDSKELVQTLVKLLGEHTNLSTKSVGAVSYAMKRYNKAPPIKFLDDKKALKLLEYNVPKNKTSGDGY